MYVYWCPICERQTERSWHYVGRAGLIPQAQEEHNCVRIEVMPVPDLLPVLALALAEHGVTGGRLGEVIPQAVWDGLTELGFISHGRDFTGEGVCDATIAGRDHLLALVRGAT